MSSQNRQSPKVFISYSWDSTEHKARVYKLSDKLRSDGINCEIDQDSETNPPDAWDQWASDEIEKNKFVLLVCTKEYLRRYKQKKKVKTGLGVKWEGKVITEQLYINGNKNKFIPIVFSNEDTNYIPPGLRTTTRYIIDPDKLETHQEEYVSLLRRLTGQPRVLKRPLGKIPVLSDQSESLNLRSSATKKLDSLPLAKELEYALWYLNHSEQVALFKCLSKKSGNVVGFRIKTSPGKNIPLFWLLKCLVKPLESDLESNVSYARLPLDSQMYANNFQVLLDDIVEKLRLPKCPRKAPVEKIIKTIREIMLQDDKHIVLLFDGVDSQAKSYLDKILNVFWNPLIKELETVNNINCRLLMCWIDYKKNVEWRDSYKFPNEPSEDDKNKLMQPSIPFNLCLQDKFEHSDLDGWVKGQNGRSAIAKCKNYDLVKDEKINNTIETIWSASQDGEPRSLLQAIYNFCKVPWEDHKDRWQDL